MLHKITIDSLSITSSLQSEFEYVRSCKHKKSEKDPFGSLSIIGPSKSAIQRFGISIFEHQAQHESRVSLQAYVKR